MPIEFRCSRCNRLLRTPDDTAGRQAKCPECGNEQTIPSPASPAATAFSPPPPPPPQTSPFSGPQGETASAPGSPYQSPEYGGPYLPPHAGLDFPRNDSKAVASLVFGILTMIIGCCCPLVALFTGGAGITLGVMSWNAANRALAVAGVICSVIGLVIALMNAILGAYLAIHGQHPLFQ